MTGGNEPKLLSFVRVRQCHHRSHFAPGYSGNGHFCVDVDECETNNGGCSQAPLVQCTNTIGSFNCEACPPGKGSFTLRKANAKATSFSDEFR